MKKSFYSIIIVLLSILANLNLFLSQNTTANVVYLPDVTFSGGLLPKENYSLSLISANVKILADTSNLRYLGEIHFSGNYTIFNPDDDINITIGAPFNFYPINDCTLLANNTIHPFIIVEDYELYREYDSIIWNEYTLDRTEIPHMRKFWILCNVSIPSNSSIVMGYDFRTPRPKSAELVKYFYVIYDVGTARLWNGNITESVDIIVQKNHPTSIYNEELCNLSNITNSMSYRWEWNNQRININYVGLYYKVDLSHEYDYIYNSIKFSLLIVISASSISLIFIKKYSNLKKRKKNNIR